MLRLRSELAFVGCRRLLRHGTRLAQECARRSPVLLGVCSLDIPRLPGRGATLGILLLSACALRRLQLHVGDMQGMAMRRERVEPTLERRVRGESRGEESRSACWRP